MTPREFNAYCKSKEFHDDYANYSNPRLSKPMKSSNGAGNSAGVAGAASSSGITTAVGPMTAQEFCRGVKRDKAHYETLKKVEGFHDWNCGFVATARMNHTHLVLDENYIPPESIPSRRCRFLCMLFWQSIFKQRRKVHG
jgi:hypothetical protein